MQALVVAVRFGMLLGLALWLGLGVALLLAAPVLERRLPPVAAREVWGALTDRLDLALLGATLLVLLGLASRVFIDRAAPPTSIVTPVAVMTVCRLVSAFAVGPACRVLLARVQDDQVPVSAAQHATFTRLQGARGILLTLEVCLSFYALYAIS